MVHEDAPMNNQAYISKFEEEVSDLIGKYSKKVSHDEMIGAFELQISALQEAMDLEGIEPL